MSVDLEISSDESGLVECCWMRIIMDDGSVITQLFIDVEILEESDVEMEEEEVVIISSDEESGEL